MKNIKCYDVTCRDGIQGAGFNLRLDGLVHAIRNLDLVTDYIEVGWPGACHLWDQVFSKIESGELSTTNAKLVAFGATRKAGLTVEHDAMLQKLILAPVPVVTIFGKSWDIHVREALRTSLDENLKMIEESVQFLTQHGKEVIFDAEHFFQGYNNNTGYALAVLQAAMQGGASTICLCDTNGIMYPEETENIVKEAVQRAANKAIIGVHMHNDRGMANANTLMALRAGAGHFQSTITGYAERSGMAATTTILANIDLLKEKEHWLLSPHIKMDQITNVATEVIRAAGLTIARTQEFIGDNAALHTAGVHVSAVGRGGASLYEGYDVTQFGQTHSIGLTSMAGMANLAPFLEKEFGMAVSIAVTNPQKEQILEVIEELESVGNAYDTAPASAAVVTADVLWPSLKFPLKDISGTVTTHLTQDGWDICKSQVGS